MRDKEPAKLLLHSPKGRRIQFRQSKKLAAGDFYVLEYREAAGQGDWRLLPGVSFHQTKELARISDCRPDQGRKVLPEQRKRTRPASRPVRAVNRERATEVPAASAFARSGLPRDEKCALADSIQMEAELPDWLNNIHPSELRFRVIEQPMNYAPQAKVAVSSEFNRDYAASLAVDGIKGIHMGHEWSSKGEATPWIQLDWPTAVTIRAVRLFDRPNPDDHTQAGTLTFSDGTSIDVAGIADDGAMKTIEFDAKTVTWAKFQVTGGRGSNRGLSEIEALSNIAPTTHTLQLR